MNPMAPSHFTFSESAYAYTNEEKIRVTLYDEKPGSNTVNQCNIFIDGVKAKPIFNIFAFVPYNDDAAEQALASYYEKNGITSSSFRLISQTTTPKTKSCRGVEFIKTYDSSQFVRFLQLIMESNKVDARGESVMLELVKKWS